MAAAAERAAAAVAVPLAVVAANAAFADGKAADPGASEVLDRPCSSLMKAIGPSLVILRCEIVAAVVGLLHLPLRPMLCDAVELQRRALPRRSQSCRGC